MNKPQNLPDESVAAAPYLQCSACGRKSWGGIPLNLACGMPQPNGTVCQGIMKEPVAAQEGPNYTGEDGRDYVIGKLREELTAARNAALSEGIARGKAERELEQLRVRTVTGNPPSDATMHWYRMWQVSTEKKKLLRAELAKLRVRAEGYDKLSAQFDEMRNRWKITFALKETAERKIATLISSADALLAYAGYHGEISRNSVEGRALIDGLCGAVNAVDPK